MCGMVARAGPEPFQRVSRSIRIGGHATSIQLEAAFWRALDAMAERVQQLDGVAVGTVEEVAKATKLKPYPTDLTKSADHIREISARLREYGARVREAIDTTDEAGDADTADILTAASQQADKDLWFIESHLE